MNQQENKVVDVEYTAAKAVGATLVEVKAILPILSAMALPDWRGSATTFAGITGTTPVKELGKATWAVISALLAPTEPAILVDKNL